MPAFYIDHNGPKPLAAYLTSRRHPSTNALSDDLAHASDDRQLLHAFPRNATLITFNRKDLLLFHHAWRRWPEAWGIELLPQHPGILIFDELAYELMAEQIEDLLHRRPDLSNLLFDWDKRRG